jgi:outer membrane protein
VADASPNNEDLIGPDVVALSLDQCVRLALEQNTDIAVVAYETPIDEASLREAWGIFDPTLRANLAYVRDDRESVQQFLGSDGTFTLTPVHNVSHLHEQSIDVTGLLPLGLVYSIGASKDETTTHEARGDGWARHASLRLPLLRGAGNTTLTQIRLARYRRDISDARVTLQVIRSLRSVIQAYWSCVAADESLKVRETALEASRKLLADNETRVRIGVAAPTEIEEAKAALSQRKSEVIGARASVQAAGERLKQVMGVRPEDPLGRLILVPADTPSLGEGVEDVRKSLELARANRLELKTEDLYVASLRTERRYAGNSVLPALDIVASTDETGGHSKTWSYEHLYSQRDDNASYSVGIEASVPLGNLRARNAYKRARLEETQAGQSRLRTQQQIEWEVVRAARELETSRQQALEYGETAELRRQTLASEQKLLAADNMSTSFRLFQMQQELVSAELQGVQARIGYQNALADLHVAQGTLLEWLGVEI